MQRYNQKGFCPEALLNFYNDKNGGSETITPKAWPSHPVLAEAREQQLPVG